MKKINAERIAYIDQYVATCFLGSNILVFIMRQTVKEDCGVAQPVLAITCCPPQNMTEEQFRDYDIHLMVPQTIDCNGTLVTEDVALSKVLEKVEADHNVLYSYDVTLNSNDFLRKYDSLKLEIRNALADVEQPKKAELKTSKYIKAHDDHYFISLADGNLVIKDKYFPEGKKFGMTDANMIFEIPLHLEGELANIIGTTPRWCTTEDTSHVELGNTISAVIMFLRKNKLLDIGIRKGPGMDIKVVDTSVRKDAECGMFDKLYPQNIAINPGPKLIPIDKGCDPRAFYHLSITTDEGYTFTTINSPNCPRISIKYPGSRTTDAEFDYKDWDIEIMKRLEEFVELYTLHAPKGTNWAEQFYELLCHVDHFYGLVDDCVRHEVRRPKIHDLLRLMDQYVRSAHKRLDGKLPEAPFVYKIEYGALDAVYPKAIIAHYSNGGYFRVFPHEGKYIAELDTRTMPVKEYDLSSYTMDQIEELTGEIRATWIGKCITDLDTRFGVEAPEGWVGADDLFMRKLIKQTSIDTECCHVETMDGFIATYDKHEYIHVFSKTDLDLQYFLWIGDLEDTYYHFLEDELKNWEGQLITDHWMDYIKDLVSQLRSFQKQKKLGDDVTWWRNNCFITNSLTVAQLIKQLQKLPQQNAQVRVWLNDKPGRTWHGNDRVKIVHVDNDVCSGSYVDLCVSPDWEDCDANVITNIYKSEDKKDE